MSKRVELFSPPKFGIVGFVEAKVGLGALMRKQDGGYEEFDGEGERGRKRFRIGDEKASMEWDGEEEL